MPVRGKTSKLFTFGLNAAQYGVNKAANFLDKLAADPPPPQSSSSNQIPDHAHAPSYGQHPYPTGAPPPPLSYASVVAPSPPQQSSNPPYTASPHYEPHSSYTSPSPPPPNYSSSSTPPNHLPNTSYSAPLYSPHAPPQANGIGVSAPLLHPPATNPHPNTIHHNHHSVHAHGPSTFSPPLHSATSMPPTSYSYESTSFSPSAPPEASPLGIPRPPQPSHPPSSSMTYGTNSSVYHYSPARFSQEKQHSYGSPHPQHQHAPAPELPPHDYDPHPSSSSTSNSVKIGYVPPHGLQQGATVHYSHPTSNHAPSHPTSRHDQVEERPNTPPDSPAQPAPEGYPHPPTAADSETYYTPSDTSHSSFVLASGMAATPSHKYSSPSVSIAGTPSAPEGTAPSSPSNASSCQTSYAGLNIVPVQIERPSETSELFMDDLLEEVYKRQITVVDSLGKLVFEEACKGLSRVLDPADETDIQLFGIQLRRSDYAACEQDYRRCARDNVPIFAISYTHRNRSVGRYDFSDEQWRNFKVAMSVLAESNIQKARIWLDQCLWMRDPNVGCWAHTGMIPYVIWPVFSLGVKVPEKDRTFDSFDRVWPYLEEIAGLWSMGVITTSELHQESEHDDVTPVTHVRYNNRVCLAPQVSLYLLFHAITDGKISNLSYGCEEDVHELMDMAKFNMDYESECVIVGSNWRARTSPLDRQSRARRFRNVSSSAKSLFITAFASGEVYLDM